MTFDLRRAQDLVDSIPEVQESIPYLTQLANGSNPEIPGYLALGKLQQISALAEAAQTNAPPQGTIKDKLTQSNGIMALMGGRGQEAAQSSQMAQMNQPGPAPEGIPQPEMQSDVPDEMMGMADGGITSAEIDPRMFNFDRGGIVTFANPESEKKQQVKDKDKEKEERKSSFDALIESLISPFKGAYESGQRAGQYVKESPGFFERLTPAEREAKERRAAPYALNAPPPQDQAAVKQAAAQREQERLRASHQLARMTGNASDSPTIAPPPAPAALPPGGINDGKTPVPGANINIGAAKPQALPENEFLNMSKQFIQEQPEAFDEAKETAKINARNEAAGIGTYANIMREQQQAMRDKFAASQPGQFEKLIGLGRAYSRAGAQAGDVGAQGAEQMRAEREAKFQFEQDQFKVTEAIEKLEEARRTGNVQAIAKAEADLKKANADKRNNQMNAATSAANTQGRSIDSALDRDQNLRIETAKLQAKKAELAQMGKDSDIAKIMKEVEALERAGKPEEANKKLELWGKANALKMGARYEGKSTAPTQKEILAAIQAQQKIENLMDFMTLSRKNAKPAEKAQAQARIDATERKVRAAMSGGIAAGDGGGGGGAKPISEAEYRALPKGATYTDPNGVERVKG
jgi:hypothetical protein